MRIGTGISRDKKKRKQEQQGQQKKEDLIKTIALLAPCMTQHLNKTPLPHCTLKEKLALDLSYYPKGYIPAEEEAPLLVNSLINPPEKNTPEGPMTEEEKEKKEEETKDKEEENQ